MSNKIYEKLNGKVVCAVVVGMGLVMGKMKKDENEVPYLNKPKVVQLMPTSETSSRVRLGELVGSPDNLYMTKKPTCLYPVLDRTIEDMYIKESTGLVRATTIPSGVIK